MFDKMLFKFNNNNKEGKKETREQTPIQRRRKLEIILAIYTYKFVIIKWKTIKNNTKKRRNWNWLLRTVFHVGNAWHRPLRKITIKRWCTFKRCLNHSITIIQKGEKRQEQIQKEKIGNNISDIVFVTRIIKWKTKKNNTKKIGEKD